MAEKGYLTIAFDPSFTGESTGTPRYMASPDINTEDFQAAIDFLSVQENVDQEKDIQTPVTNKIKKYTSYKGQNYNNIGIINIPRLGINYPILETTTEKALKVSVTKFWGGNPNEVGNLCIIGHNYKNSKFFGKLHNIQNGDTVQITDMNGNTLNYSVYDSYIVTPEDTSCTTQLTNGKIEVTLITCYYENGNAHATKRLIVKARAN